MSIVREISKCLKRFIQPVVCRYTCTNAAEPHIEEIMNPVLDKNRIVWIDMEMTGLDVEKDRVLEVACLITDENLKIVSDEFDMVVHQSESELENMNDWCKTQHGKTNLTEASRNSTENEESVDKSLLNFMQKYIPKGKCPMAGNSVYMDRLFLRKYMPESNEYMHYRIIDVSSIKEVVKRWKPDTYKNAPSKISNHRALDDIKLSIQELEFYKKKVFCK